MTQSSRRRGHRGGPSDRAHTHAERVHHAVARELAELFREEIADPVLDEIAILEVESSPDGRYLRVHVAASHPNASNALSRASGFLRARLTEALDFDRVPELRFVVHPRGAR